MPVNASERHLHGLAESSFLKLWTVPNPFRAAGKELTDILIPFGNDLIVISDKASEFSGAMPLAWERWSRRTIQSSRKQLGGAARILSNAGDIYLDDKASRGLGFPVPPVSQQRLHLIAVARPNHDPGNIPEGWSSLTYDANAARGPFKVGLELTDDDRFIHMFDGDAIDFLLNQLDTAPDFLSYLKSRETVLRQTSDLIFAERDLFAIAASGWEVGGSFDIHLPDPDADGRVIVPAGLWDEYIASEGATLTAKRYANSKNVDLLIEHFHSEYAARRTFHHLPQSFTTHEQAMRLLASESRFSRRLIADRLVDLLKEDNNRTFWAATLPSPDHQGVRYVWLTYPQPPVSEPLEKAEKLVWSHLRSHLWVARLKFGPAVYVGIAVPNRDIEMKSYAILVVDGYDWSEENDAEAKHWLGQGVFADLEQHDLVYHR